MLETELSLGEIAKASGFTATYFNTLFASREGVAPGAELLLVSPTLA